jgi:hypothetical protein
MRRISGHVSRHPSGGCPSRIIDRKLVADPLGELWARLYPERGVVQLVGHAHDTVAGHGAW